MKRMGFFERMKDTMYLRTWSAFKVPLINMMSPRVQDLNDDSCSVLIPLNYWTKNHFRTLYISTQITGADLGAGLLTMHHIRKQKAPVSLIFKDLKADFKKRPDADTLFTCSEGREISELIAEAMATGKRVNRTVTILATCPSKYGDTVVSEFKMTLSLKKTVD